MKNLLSRRDTLLAVLSFFARETDAGDAAGVVLQVAQANFRYFLSMSRFRALYYLSSTIPKKFFLKALLNLLMSFANTIIIHYV